jgi:hypothetical protein
VPDSAEGGVRHRFFSAEGRAWRRFESAFSIALPVGSVIAFYAVIATLRMQQHDALWFVHIGRQFLTTSDTSSVIRPSLGWQSEAGYDGQYYFAVAADPHHARDYMGGSAGYVYSRALYPAVARAASLGSVDALPYAMLIVNLLAAAVATLAVALWLRRHGTPAWPAALFGLYPGFVFTVLRDLTEPLAFALVALAVLAWHERRTGRLVLSAVLFALAALTRETVLPFAAAAAAALVVADARRSGRWRDWRSWRRGLYFGAASVAPLLAWRAVVAGSLHEPTQERGAAGWGVPFHGIVSYWPWDPQHRVAVLTVVFPALAALAGALVLLWRGRAPVAATLLVVNVLLFVVFLPKSVYVDYAAAARASVGVVLAALYCLPAWLGLGARETYRATIIPRALVLAVAFAWSLGWYLPVARHYGLSGLELIST